jgi:hypothetical protein
MIKSGLITAAVNLVLLTIVGWLFALCGPCLAIFIGLGAGYLAGLFDKPATNNLAVRAGAGAGAIGGVGAIVGHLIGGSITMLITPPEQAAAIYRSLGIDIDVSNTAAYYAGGFGTACCFGIVGLALMAGLGALGGMLWYRMSGQSATQPPMGMQQ